MSRMSHVTTTLDNTNSWPLTIGLPKRKVVSKISKPPFFSGYVSFTVGSWWFEPRFLGSNKQIQGKLWLYDQGLVKTPLLSLGFRPTKFHPFRRKGVTGIIEALSLAWRALRAARSTLQAEVRHGFLGGWNPPPPLPCGFFMTLQCFLFLGKVVPSHYKHQPTIWRDVSPIKRKWMFHCHDKWDLECHQPYPRNKALTAGLSKRDLVVNNPLLGCA